MSDSDSSLSPVRYATIEQDPGDAKQKAVSALNNYLSAHMDSLQIQTLAILIANVGIAFGENAHTWTLAKSYLVTIATLKDHHLATANALIPISTNLCYPAYGGQPIMLRRKHARQLNEPWFQRRLRWDQSLCNIDRSPDRSLQQAIGHFKAYAPAPIRRNLAKIFPTKFALRLQDILCE